MTAQHLQQFFEKQLPKHISWDSRETKRLRDMGYNYRRLVKRRFLREFVDFPESGIFFREQGSIPVGTNVIRADGKYDRDIGLYIKAKCLEEYFDVEHFSKIHPRTLRQRIAGLVDDRRTNAQVTSRPKCVTVTFKDTKSSEIKIDLPILVVKTADAEREEELFKPDFSQESEAIGFAKWFKSLIARADDDEIEQINTIPRYTTINEQHYYLAAAQWERSDPVAILKWIRSQLKERGDKQNQQKRRILKTIKYIMFSRGKWCTGNISGFFLTLLIIENFSYQMDRDDTSIIETLKSIRRRIKKRKRIFNPVDGQLLSNSRTHALMDNLVHNIDVVLRFCRKNGLHIKHNNLDETARIKKWQSLLRFE